LLNRYGQEKVDIIAVGFGNGAEQVQAFNNDGQHYIRIEKDHPEDIAEAIAKIVEHKSKGTGMLSRGDITAYLKLNRSKKGSLATSIKSSPALTYTSERIEQTSAALGTLALNYTRVSL
ncbi:MAG: hypothetical protein NTV71_00185, partial [Candidatus Omnitrophica bacterium]|nr:hypothetical protein [Candidatus Omnitrophota bacterium]